MRLQKHKLTTSKINKALAFQCFSTERSLHAFHTLLLFLYFMRRLSGGLFTSFFFWFFRRVEGYMYFYFHGALELHGITLY